MTFKVRVEGTAATIANFALLGKRVAKKVMVKAARAGGQVHVREARRRAPRGNRLLVKSLAVVLRRYPAGASATMGQERTKGVRAVYSRAKNKRSLRRGGISGRGDFVPIHLVENPVRPHRIEAKQAPKLLWQAGGKMVAAKAVDHPGHKGGGQLRHASKAAFNEARRATEQKLEMEVEREASALVPF